MVFFTSIFRTTSVSRQVFFSPVKKLLGNYCHICDLLLIMNSDFLSLFPVSCFLTHCLFSERHLLYMSVCPVSVKFSNPSFIVLRPRNFNYLFLIASMFPCSYFFFLRLPQYPHALLIVSLAHWSRNRRLCSFKLWRKAPKFNASVFSFSVRL